MSRTRIIKMENKIISNIDLSSLLGLNAYSLDDTGDCFQNNINKSLGNGKQYINGDLTTSISDVNNSLLNTLDMIDSTIKTDAFYVSPKDENTYTLDDLLDLGNEDLNPSDLFDTSLEDDNLLLTSDLSTNIILDTAMSSPLSSSSEESCDLDEILFMDTPTEPNDNKAMQTEVLTDLAMHKESLAQNDSVQTIDQSLLQDLLSSNGADLNTLCSLLFQSQNLATVEAVEEIETLYSSGPSSPATSESETESVRYMPYKKQKTPEQKQRKKAQNRTAATRYRVKKKDELKAMTEEADQLEMKNKDLKGKVDGLKSEIDYLKNLMLDVIKARLAKGALPENLLSVVMAQ